MRSFLKTITMMAAFVLLFSSCASLSGMGVGRVKKYTLHSERLPEAFDGVRVAFLSDFHYPSLFTAKRLAKLVSKLQETAPDALLFGGDYVPSEVYLDTLFSSFSSVETTFGKFAVMGNHDYVRRAAVEAAMSAAGIRLLADECEFLVREGDSLCVAGVYNSFKIGEASDVFVASLPGSLFTIVLSHTPDFAQDTHLACDLVLSGHTHGGQVSLLHLYTPVKNTKYKTRFLRGLNRTDEGVPVITTNGVGTSRRKVRFCVPSEVVVVTLRCASRK